MLYTMLTIKNVLCLHIWVNYKESLRRIPRSTYRWFSPCSYQALRQATPLSCLDRKMKRNLFFWKPRSQQTLFQEAGPENIVFWSHLKNKAHHHLRHLWTWSLMLLLPLGAFCWAKSSGRCLTKEGPCPCPYGLPECPRTFSVIFSKRDNTYSLPQFPSWLGHLRIQGQALIQRWHNKDHEPQVYAPDVRVTQLRVSPFSIGPALIYRGWKEDLSISATECLKSRRQRDSSIEARTGWVS